MNYEEMQKWLEEQLEKARQYRIEKGKPPMTPLEESELRDRLRLSIAR